MERGIVLRGSSLSWAFGSSHWILSEYDSDDVRRSLQDEAYMLVVETNMQQS